MTVSPRGNVSPDVQQQFSIDDFYNRYFEIVPAKTPELLDQVYRLRYRVYCVEHPFLDPQANPNDREIDAFDDQSVHSLLIHRATRAACGTVRLIVPQPGRGPEFFPVHDLGAAAASMIRRLPKHSTAEISRFAVSKDFRRRAGETIYADVAEPAERRPNDRRVLPHITYGLMRAVLLMSLENRITHLCAVMEPTLLRLLARFGLHFQCAGPLVDYHGMRQPCFATLMDLLAGVERARRDMWEAGTENGRLLPHPIKDVVQSS